MVDPKFHDDLMAELSAINMAVIDALTVVAAAQQEPTKWLDTTVERGARGLANVNLWSVPDDRKTAAVESSIERYTDILASVRENLRKLGLDRRDGE